MAYNTNIGVGAPPLLWSNVQEAFDAINQNFVELGVVLSNSLEIEPLDFTNLSSGVGPSTSNQYGLGTLSKSWKNIYLTQWSNVSGSELNGLWLGGAHVKGIGSTVELPANSTVGGELIINPANTSWKTFSVPGQDDVVADTFTDTLNLTSTTGITITTNATTDTINIANSGVRSLTGTTHLGVSDATGEVTLTNLGVTDLTAGPGISIDNNIGSVEITNTGIRGITSGGGGITVFIDANNVASISNTAPVTRSFSTIKVPGSDDLTADITSDILKIVPGYGIDITTSEVPGSGASESEQLNIVFNNNVDINGSVFADNSTLLVDGADGRIVGPVYTSILRTSEQKIAIGDDAGLTNQGEEAVAIGWFAGETNQGVRGIAIGRAAGSDDQAAGAIAIGNDAGRGTQGTGAVAVGYNSGITTQGASAVAIGFSAGIDTQGASAIAVGQFAGGTDQGSNAIAAGYYAGNNTQGTGAIALGYVSAQITQGDSAVAIGWAAGQTNQGDYAIAIGYRAGFTNQNASSIVLNASGVALEAPAAGFFVNPIRSNSTGRPLIYDAATSELSYSSVLEFVGSTISTSDSSGITVDVQTRFNTQVTVDGTLTVSDGITGYLSLAELKSVVAASSSFADFQSKIAAL